MGGAQITKWDKTVLCPFSNLQFPQPSFLVRTSEWYFFYLMAPIYEDNVTIITKFTDTIIIIRSRMTRIGEILESGSKAGRWRGGWPLSLLVVRSRVSSPICALLLSISRGISPFPTFAKIFLCHQNADNQHCRLTAANLRVLYCGFCMFELKYLYFQLQYVYTQLPRGLWSWSPALPPFSQQTCHTLTESHKNDQISCQVVFTVLPLQCGEIF